MKTKLIFIMMLILVSLLGHDSMAQTDSTSTSTNNTIVETPVVTNAESLPLYGYGQDVNGDRVLFIDTKFVLDYGRYARHFGVDNKWKDPEPEAQAYQYGSRSFYFKKPLNQANTVLFLIAIDTVHWDGKVWDTYLPNEAMKSKVGHKYYVTVDSPGVELSKDDCLMFNLTFDPTYTFELRVPDN